MVRVDEPPFEIGPIRMTPLRVPMENRLQTMAVAWYLSSMLLMPIACTVIVIAVVLTPWMWWLIPVYGAWFIYDHQTPRRGGRPWKWFRESPVAKRASQYFPVRLHKIAELPPDRNYLIGCHPHGVVSYSHFINFATNATGVDYLFPKLKIRLCTLAMNFNFPLKREINLGYGLVECSKESLIHHLGSEEKGHVSVLVIGGAQEALDAHPGVNALTLANRKGFVKIALTTGASLVPVYSFGENEIFNQFDNPEGSTVRHLQEVMKSVTGVSGVMFYGRSFFTYNFGFLPYRHPIDTVVGEPIALPKIAEPTQEDIDRYHSRYIDALRELFDKYKTQFGYTEKDDLVIH